jgi:hypothetical protein
MTMSDVALQKALKQAKTKKMHFAFVPKGNDGKLIVAVKKIPAKDVADAKKKLGGSAPLIGKCFGEGELLVFQVAKEAGPTMADVVKKVAKRETGLTIAPEFRVAEDAEGEEPQTQDPQEAAKTEFEKNFPALDGRVTKAKAADATIAGMTPLVQAMNAAHAAVTQKQTAGDYVAANGLLADLATKTKAVEDHLAAQQSAKKTCDDGWKAMKADREKADKVFEKPAFKTEHDAYDKALTDFAKEYKAKDYVKAATFVDPLKQAAKDLVKAAADHDKVAGPKASAALQTVKDKKKLAGKSNAEKLQLLRDLRGPSTAMTPELRAAQREIYKTLKLDKEFVKEDKKKRKDIVGKLIATKADKAEFKDKRKNWKKQTDDEKLNLIRKAIKAQSEALGIPAPEVVAINEPIKDGLITNGYFNPNDGKIYINLNPDSSVHDFEKAIDLAFHENSHNYQNELVKLLKDGKLPKTDPRYEQALLFEINLEPQAYVRGAENFDVYKKQPLEEHAHKNGPETAKALIKAFR